jgi:hypothetical protein
MARAYPGEGVFVVQVAERIQSLARWGAPGGDRDWIGVAVSLAW